MNRAGPLIEPTIGMLIEVSALFVLMLFLMYFLAIAAQYLLKDKNTLKSGSWIRIISIIGFCLGALSIVYTLIRCSLLWIYIIGNIFFKASLVSLLLNPLWQVPFKYSFSVTLIAVLCLFVAMGLTIKQAASKVKNQNPH